MIKSTSTSRNTSEHFIFVWSIICFVKVLKVDTVYTKQRCPIDLWDMPTKMSTFICRIKIYEWYKNKRHLVEIEPWQCQVMRGREIMLDTQSSQRNAQHINISTVSLCLPFPPVLTCILPHNVLTITTNILVSVILNQQLAKPRLNSKTIVNRVNFSTVIKRF